MRSIGISIISLALTAVVIGNAYYQKKQFYPSVVYITKSNPSMAVIYSQSLVLVVMLGKLMRKIFLGTLRAAEFEHLMERFWYALTETCLAFTVFRDDFNPKFVALFTVLLFLKSFHWLAEDRVDFMERSPVIGLLFHLRVASLLVVLAFLDYLMISHAYHSTMSRGATVQLVFGFEYAILITMIANTTIKYVLHAAEMRSDSPWDNKAVVLLYTELVIGLVRVILYILFVIIMVRIYTLPLFAFRPMYYTMRNFKKALNDVILSRRAIRNMNTLYPDATPEELALSDNICIICREDMVNSSKKLPCGHIFHTACLRSWFQRQQTCPTCRLNILRTPITANQPQNAQNIPLNNNNTNNNNNNENQNNNIAGVNNNNNNNNVNANNNNNNNVNDQNRGIPINPFANLLQNHPPPPPLNFNLRSGSSAETVTPPIFPGAPPFLLPPLPFVAPYTMPPPPPMPPALDTLSEEELRALEGTERHHIEERIKLLRNVQLMLNASVALMNQYNTVMANIPLPIPPLVPDPQPNLNINDPQPSTSTSSSTQPIITTNTDNTGEASSSSPVVNNNENSNDFIKLDDVGSEEHLDLPKTTQQQTVIDEPNQLNNNDTLIFSNDETDAAELRRRRLQKFEKTDKTEDTDNK